MHAVVNRPATLKDD